MMPADPDRDIAVAASCPQDRLPGEPPPQRLRGRLLSIPVVAACSAAAPLAAQQAEPPAVAAVRLAEGGGAMMRVDGLLDDPPWRAAPVATGFRQREPRSGTPATEVTEVRVVYDGTTLYIGVLARDKQPGATISRILQRDRVMEQDPFTNLPRFAGDDAVAIILDPFHDHRSGVVFATNPNGAEFDALITDEGREFNVDWRAVWRVAASRTPHGWSAEFAIPFRTLRYPSGATDEPWGFNVYRVIRRKNEEVLWSAWSRENEGFHRVSRAGHLAGLTNLPRRGLNLEAKPYLLTGATQEQGVTEMGTEGRLEAGADLKVEVRPGLLLDVTLNTDFAQVEVDDEQVNLTRFDLFFPEKREFFLENAGIFDFGWRSAFEPPPFLMFFSRQIGIAEDGEVPVFGGVRLTGRVGRQTVGLLSATTDEAFGEPVTNFAVARVKRDVGGSSYVGAMLADKRSGASWNTAGGVDFSLWPTAAVNVQGFAARTGARGAGGEGTAYRLGVDYSGDRFGFNGGHLVVGADATADMGFITRTDIRRTDALGRVTPRPPTLGLRKVDVFLLGQWITRTDGALQDWQAGLAIGPEWSSGDGIDLFYIRGFTRLDESFEIEDGVEVPVGGYDLWQAGWFGSTSRSRAVVLESTAIFQGIYGGTVHTVSGTLTLRPNANLSVSAAYTRNLVDVPSGAFTADIGALRLAYAASTRLFANALVQYNSLDRAISANIRVNLIHRPGSDLFLVWNEQRGSETSVWDFDNRTAVIKLTYLARF